MNLRPCRVPDFDRLVASIACLNTVGAFHIGYFGLRPAGIAHTLQALNPRLAEEFILYGPLIDHADWHALPGPGHRAGAAGGGGAVTRVFRV